MVTFHDILGAKTADEARAMIAEMVGEFSRPRDVVWCLGARWARENSPEYGWDLSLPEPILIPWRARVAEAVFLRWQHVMRDRLLADVIEDAARDLEQRAAALGVRLRRKPLDEILDVGHMDRLRRGQ